VNARKYEGRESSFVKCIKERERELQILTCCELVDKFGASFRLKLYQGELRWVIAVRLITTTNILKPSGDNALHLVHELKMILGQLMTPFKDTITLMQFW
jgi:hypothetical protein